MNKEDRHYYEEALRPLIEDGWTTEKAVEIVSDDFDEFEENSDEHMEVLNIAWKLQESL